MIVFAADSSTRAGSAAVLRDGEIAAERCIDAGLTHSETLLPLCDEVFRQAKVTPADIDFFAVTIGPGSFTGLRIGMGTIKGLAFATGKPCAAIPTLEALAYNLSGSDKIIVPVLDARRDRVYTAAFLAERGEIARLCPDRVVDIDSLADNYKDKKIVLIGDAAVVCYNRLRDKLDCAIAPELNLLPKASGAAHAALRYIARGETVHAAGLVPEYIQIPQAERERRERENK